MRWQYMEADPAGAIPSMLFHVWELTGVWTWIGVGVFCLLLIYAVLQMIRGSSLGSRLAFCVSCPIPLLCGVADFGWRCFAMADALGSSGDSSIGWIYIDLLGSMVSVAIGAGLSAILFCVAGVLVAPRKSKAERASR
jgi:hypothetical protein